MLIGGAVLTFVSLREVGGYSQLMERYGNATAEIWSNATVPYEKMKCAKPAKVSCRETLKFNVRGNITYIS